MDTQPKSARIVQDTYTKALVEIFKYLAQNNGLIKKKDFADVVQYPLSNLNKVLGGERNFPNEIGQRAVATDRLVETYKVNRDFMKGLSKKMFTEPPPRYEQAMPSEGQKYNFRNAGEKRELLNERDEYKQKYEAAEEEIANLKEQLKQYQTGKTPDNNPDIAQ